MGVKVTPLKLRLQDEALPLVAAVAKELLLAQLSMGIDGTGKRHFHPNGVPWDFRESGRFLDSLSVAWKEGRITLIFDVEYAIHIDTKAPLSMSPDTRKLFTERITPILKQHVTSK